MPANFFSYRISCEMLNKYVEGIIFCIVTAKMKGTHRKGMSIVIANNK